MRSRVCWNVRWMCGGLLVLAALSMMPTTGSAQGGDPRAAMRKTATDAMARFAWLEGEWEGPATISMGGRSMALTQRETVQRSAMNTALIIQGRGSMRMGGPDAPEREVFAAAGILTYDGSTGKYLMFSASGSGQAQQFSIELLGADGIVWGYSDAAGVKIRYTITRTAEGAWKEIGETSRDNGATWSPMMEMVLTKK